jgi:hypothetical protein
MSEVPHPTGGDEGCGLDALLVLLNGAADSFRTVQATYRTWRHEQRLHEAFRLHHAEQMRRGVATNIVASAVHSGGPGPAEPQETMRIWREGQRARQEHHGGWRDGSYSIADGRLWWSWSEQTGAATSNQDDPSITSSNIGRELQVMLNPSPLLSVLDFRVTGDSQVYGRATITAHATPRHESLTGGRLPGDPHARRDLYALGIGADSYQLEVDRERGVLLAATAIRDEQPFYKITALAIRFDEPIPAETFQFRPPEGEQIQSPRELPPRPQLVSLTEAQRRAAFTILLPDRMPADWQQVYCMFDKASPWSPEHVLLNYRSDDGRQSFSIWQMAALDASQHYGNMFDDESWYEVARDGTSIKIRPAGEWLPAQAHLKRNETFVRLSSQSLAAEQLATIAASLRFTPSTGSF